LGCKSGSTLLLNGPWEPDYANVEENLTRTDKVRTKIGRIDWRFTFVELDAPDRLSPPSCGPPATIGGLFF
jgi:hypothetical protein